MKPVMQVMACLLLLVSPLAFAADSDVQNLIENGGFEQSLSEESDLPAVWVPFSSKSTVLGITNAAAYSGEKSLKLSGQEVPNAFQGVNFIMPVTAGSRYTFSGYVLNDKKNPLKGTAHGMLVIEWKASNNKEVARTLSKLWDSGLSRLRWERFSIDNMEPPKDAVTAIFGIHYCEGKDGAKGSFFIDEVTLIEK